ncbi:class I SAM-dependent methyltransferase [Candidatus Pelagibacter sp.]|nr:class I SAM-dependent methyltransferase [Candidatus Pelagibacter sp.]
MQKYLKALYDIFKNYRSYAFTILINEIIFQFKYNGELNKFKYLDSKFQSDSIPCSYFFLKKIKKFILKNDINYSCDLGSGYGKILYFLGNLNNHKIDGVELDKEIYSYSLTLKNINTKVFNEDILRFDIKSAKYDLFILNDPLKKLEDLKKLIARIKNFYNTGYIVLINLDEKKLQSVLDDLEIIDSLIISKSRNILFCSIEKNYDVSAISIN